MIERPILFSAPMVRAILDGTKTQTRRVVKGVPADLIFTGAMMKSEGWVDFGGRDEHKRIHCPYGQPGDRLWVRETFSGPHCMEASEGCASVPPSKWARSSRLWYWADGNPADGDWTRPRPSIHMPRWASRITLEVTGVRVERLHDITEADAVAEGASTPGPFAVHHFMDLWTSINGAESWNANPWVWVVEFKRITG